MSLREGLVEYFPLDEASGNTTGAHAATVLTQNGTVGQTTGLVYANVRDFEVTGGADYFSRANDTIFDRGNTDWTMAVWFYRESEVSTPMLVTMDFVGSNRSYNLSVSASTDEVKWNVSANGTNMVEVAATSPTISDAAWYCAIFGHDSVNDVIFLRVNGGTRFTTAHSGGVFDSTAAFQISGRNGNSLPWDGRIGPFALWSRVLTTAEEDAFYNSGAGLTYTGTLTHSTLTCTGGSYTISGTAATPKATRTLSCVSGSYSVAGTAATLSKGVSLAAAVGSYAITGSAASLLTSHRIDSSAGALAISGTTASLERSLIVSADAGSYVWTGNAAALGGGIILTAVSGGYSLSGTAASLIASHSVVLSAGGFTATGTAASLERGYVVSSSAVAYSVTGADATLTQAGSGTATGGIFSITGTASQLLWARLLSSAGGSLAVAGTAATLDYDRYELPPPSVYTSPRGRFNRSTYHVSEQTNRSAPQTRTTRRVSLT